MSNEFQLPTRLRIAPACRHELGEVLKELGASRVLLVTDEDLLHTAMIRETRNRLEEAALAHECFSEVPRNPRTTTAESIAALCQPGDVIVSMGGGSVLDAGKAAAMLATNGGRARDWLGRTSIPHEPLPFVAIPTTCGTGSEVTWVSVLTDEEQQRKISLKGRAMFPTLALVDAEVLRSLPAPLIASTGMDALTHALEATTGLRRNPVSDALAETAIALLMRHLPRAFRSGPKDDEALEAVMRASTLAGLAFGNSDVGAVHCLSETLGGLYDVPHGLANALLLVPVLRSHGDSVSQRLTQLHEATKPVVSPGSGSAESFLAQLAGLVADFDLGPLERLRIRPEDKERIAERAAANGSNPSNPRSMGADDYREILEAL